MTWFDKIQLRLLDIIKYSPNIDWLLLTILYMCEYG